MCQFDVQQHHLPECDTDITLNVGQMSVSVITNVVRARTFGCGAHGIAKWPMRATTARLQLYSHSHCC
jgi:hypothetical protein